MKKNTKTQMSNKGWHHAYLKAADRAIKMEMERNEALQRIKILESGSDHLREALGRVIAERDNLRKQISEAHKALEGIAGMPYYDQDDQHRLRHRARFFLQSQQR